MRKFFIALIAALSVAASCSPREPQGPKVFVGDAVPAFEAETLSGDIFDSRDFRGKPTVLVFFSTGCVDCREELPTLQAFHEACGDDVVRLMLVGRGETASGIRAYWKENALTLPACAGNGRNEYNLFAYSGIPRTFIYDKGGVIRLTYGPEDRPSVNALLSFVESIR